MDFFKPPTKIVTMGWLQWIPSFTNKNRLLFKSGYAPLMNTADTWNPGHATTNKILAKFEYLSAITLW